MSRERARAALNGEMTDRIPQWDVPDCPALAEQLFDYNVQAEPHRACIGMLKHFDVDATISSIPGDCAEWNFPLVRYYEDATFTDDPENERYKSLPRAPSPRPYNSMYDALGMKAHGAFWGFSPTLTMQNHPCSSPEEVLEFQPLDHFTQSQTERAAFFKNHYAEKQTLLGDSTMVMGWYYHTLFMWPVELFGWENFMMAAMDDPKRFEEMLLQFLEVSKRDFSAMCESPDIELIGCHDDLCSANGPMFPPEWYDQYIFPHYNEVLDIIHSAGKKAFFCCDGNLMPLLDRIRATDFDGIACDGNNDLETVLDVFSGKTIFACMQNPNIINFGSPDEIRDMVRETAKLAKREPGYFFSAGTMTGKTPPENILIYQEAVRKFGAR
ncbi:uroporphyrinogen decarboxylase family protein [Pontiella sulfatireligans]|uniref:Uroporphyrinogen decarboxylase (URO-D) domain-containing protein n=1 Tax=Pontiella sulfatireligans TaxID=2750658 RepID=A0A6C2UE66_9BACT|nr:uroporphyrinogen decarboxylase family protein [Pontiella sulfatireligans]VGO18199.1 hypothetical protein SCARR_00250 [Pontiella sulfatireligans]